MKACKTCLAWCRNREEDNFGECRKHAPTSVGTGGFGWSQKWHLVMEYDWCLEYESKKDSSEECLFMGVL